MELTPYLEGLRRDLAAAAAPGGPDVLRAADLLAGSLDASARLCLLEALSDAAAEITTKLGGNSVEVRLRGREAQFVVNNNDHERATTPRDREPPTSATAPIPSDGDLTRMTLRLPESLKEAIERAAATEAISVNAWLVRALTRTITQGSASTDQHNEPPRRGRTGRHLTGFAEA